MNNWLIQVESELQEYRIKHSPIKKVSLIERIKRFVKETVRFKSLDS